ncbi:hypothetical protein L1987_43044 [Smallanthus sonchifolius]|uniref:Uncharacterized protein n=1 Tax=Smallanthus sonchifolius TaxID=185202 RepID=A0ACB9GKB9_9ASTR|nr:hypothetical protein L1987_43044 [Smallanthus sonchifolius]
MSRPDVSAVGWGVTLPTPWQAHASRRAKNGASAKAVDYETQKRLDAMELQMARLGKVGGKDVVNVSQGYPVCDGCGDLGHNVASCLRDQGKAKEGGNQQQYQNRQQGYNQGGYQRNQGNQGYQQGSYQQRNYQQNQAQQFQQQGNEQNKPATGNDPQLTAIIESLKRIEQDREIQMKTNESFKRQLGQLAKKLAKVAGRPQGQLPSDTKLNPQHQGASSSSSKNAYVSAVSNQEDDEESESEDDGEQGEPIILVKVGGLKIDQALLDYWSSVSILLGSLYDRSDIGPLQQVDTTVVLADLTRRARGMIKGVAVKTVKEKQARVNLGRPFLATANAQIKCTDNTVSATNKCLPRSKVDEGGTKDKSIVVDRSELKNEMNKVVDAATHKCGDERMKLGEPPWKHQAKSLGGYNRPGTGPSRRTHGCRTHAKPENEWDSWLFGQKVQNPSKPYVTNTSSRYAKAQEPDLRYTCRSSYIGENVEFKCREGRP